ncbi:hypothetical protein UP10_00440 [Bradyrhizobium sp. LTSPM299]|uniref:HepT-like ribonuclease domain-containing protein n=1 Tax=Bradyrhizobium sp. LTSPM299 TaxID=1619233 RepID=UPI0005C982C7|nr:DUF86 domain-containing protein [Bradyrhizobium sp. LTSPM299]KJC62692.1 hypothetical protein UP10_00440 [Bradyrhizobium sp. LTSPM299]
MPPTVEDRLRDILEAITEIEGIVAGSNFEQFSTDKVRRLATERLLEIVCEASRRIPDSVKDPDVGIDWRKMIDFGNVLRHAYHATRVDIVWDIVRIDLPALKAFVSRKLTQP